MSETPEKPESAAAHPAEAAAAPPAVENAAPVPDAAAAAEPAKPESAEAPKVPEPKPAEAKDEVADPHEEATLMEKAGEKPEEKKAEEKTPEDKPGEEKPEEKKPEAAKPVPIELKPYTLPEGFKADDTAMGQFNLILTDAEVDPQTRGQRMVDLHIAEQTKLAQHMAMEQRRVWADTRRGWVDSVKADPELGGARFETVMAGIARMRDLFVPEAEMKEFKDFLRITGAGDHPAWLRLMNRVRQRFDEPASGNQVAFKPPADIGQKPKSAGNRRAALYDNERSEARRTR